MKKNFQAAALPFDGIAIALWSAGVACAALLRQEYIGDGLRHLPAVLNQSLPAFGEPRWLLFPAVLFGLIRPWVLLGAVTNLEAAAKVFTGICFLCGLIYLLALRSWLMARKVSVGLRAAGLLLAGASVPLLWMSSDIAEPQIAAAIAVSGLAFAACQANVRGGEKKAVLAAVASIAIASLIYQGLFLALFLLPCAVPWKKWGKFEILFPALTILALVPAVMLASLLGQGDSLRESVTRIFFAEANPFFRNFLKKEGIASYLAASLAGPSLAVVWIREFSGLKALTGFFPGFQLIFGFTVVVASVAAAVRRKNWAVVIAFCGMMILPLLRHQQYVYFKLYVLLPAILALAAAHLRPAFVYLMAGILFLMNGMTLAKDVQHGRGLYAALVPLYERAGGEACWLSSAWGPPIPYKWPGKNASLLMSLSIGQGEDPAELIQKQHAEWERSLRQCFCHGSEIYTGDMTWERRDEILKVAGHFQYPNTALLQSIFWRPEKGEKVLSQTQQKVFRYSDPARQEICLDLREKLEGVESRYLL